MDLTKPPIPTFRRLPQPYHLSNSIDCLVALATGDGDARDCNKAAEELVDTLEVLFYAVVEYAETLPEFFDLTPSERGDFIYYSIMERQGHGVGLTCDPGRFPEKAIDLARDKASDLYGKVGAIVDWIEQNLNDDGSYAIKGNLVVEVSVYTEASVEDNSETAASTFLKHGSLDKILDEVDEWADDCDPVPPADADEHEGREVTLGAFIETLDEVLENHPVEQSGTGWRACYDQDALLSRRSYRNLPRLSGLEQGDDECDEEWDRRSEVIGADVSWFIAPRSLTTDHNGPTEQVKWLNENPEGLVDELVRSTDWYYKQYKAAKAAEAAAKAAKEKTDAHPSEVTE
jgi:hypothetical protein